MGWLSKIVGEPGPKMVSVAVVDNEPQTELLLSLLKDAQIPAFARLSAGFAGLSTGLPRGGPREILVPEHFELDARAVIEPLLAEPPGE